MQRCTGRDPSPLELSERLSRRQIGPAHHFIEEEEEIFVYHGRTTNTFIKPFLRASKG